MACSLKAATVNGMQCAALQGVREMDASRKHAHAAASASGIDWTRLPLEYWK